MVASESLKIGLSACFFHGDSERAIFKGKTLQYLEQSMAQWVMSEGALCFMIPAPSSHGPVKLKHLATEMDGLVLQAGSDVSPRSYGEEPKRPEWNGDGVRDRYEMALLEEFMVQKKPILGVCRGAQLINVALGGTLFQDIAGHRDWKVYDQLFHEVSLVEGSKLSELYQGETRGKINSVHHQSIKALGQKLVAEAHSIPDGIIEAIRYTGDNYIFAVQWHPEFQDPQDQGLLNGKLILQEFLSEVKRRKGSAHAESS